MPGRVFATHDIDVGEHQVVKRYRSWERGEHLREWQALVMLASCAPDLAPAPLGCDLDSVPPHIRMSRIPGRPLAGQAITPGHLDVVTATIDRLHTAVPADILAAVPPQPWLAVGAISRMESHLTAVRRPDDAEPVKVETGALLGRFQLTAAETARVLFFRRGFGFFWLLKLLGAREDRLSALQDQALRLLVMLDSCGGS